MFENLFSIEGRTALVTGGSRGIGKMIAAGFVAHGARVYITSRKAEDCDATAEELSRDGGTCISLPHDLSTVEGCRALTEDYLARQSSLDVLVNNAGAAWAADFDEFPEHGWDKVMNLNVKSPFFLTQALHPALAKAGSHERPSKVINIASIDGIRLNPLETYSYHASKSALIYLTRRVAARLVRDHIVVNAIAPGPFPSKMNRAARDQGDEVAKRTPMRRVGAPEDMAGAAIYLASRAGDYVVGETIAVDGGIAHANLPGPWT
ncbi:MAG: SDR family oxidoreductase [Myxococcales bacterium]|jgi:2-deoxy-D-gluconate 3-dehydrogenase